MKKIILIVVALTLLTLVVKKIGINFSYQEAEPSAKETREALEKRASELRKLDNSQIPKQNLCGNSFFPFVPGASWRYNATFKDQKKIIEIITPPEKEGNQPISVYVSPDSFSMEALISCTPRGVVINNLNFLHILDAINTITTPQEIRGFFIPIDFNQRASWNLEIVSKNEKANGLPEKWQRTDKITFSFIGEEEIKIEQGEVYKTKRIDSSWLIKREEIKENSIDKEDEEELKSELTDSTASCTFWLADQTGIVKSIYKEKGVEYPIILELRSFQIPAIPIVN